MDAQHRFDSITMNSVLQDIFLRTRTSNSKSYGADERRKIRMKTLPQPSSQSDKISTLAPEKLALSKANKQSERTHRIANGIKEHVKGKLSFGAKLLRAGGMKKVFKQIFNAREGEKLLNASQCCLSTTAGPIAGVLFISTDRIAFCSDRSVVKLSSPTGESLRFHYKVVIPLRMINRAIQSENTKKKSKNYLHLITTDEFEFWFLGFLNYKKMFKCLQEANSPAMYSHN